jgi:hypothetical protein
MQLTLRPFGGWLVCCFLRARAGAGRAGHFTLLFVVVVSRLRASNSVRLRHSVQPGQAPVSARKQRHHCANLKCVMATSAQHFSFSLSLFDFPVSPINNEKRASFVKLENAKYFRGKRTKKILKIE